MRFLYLGILLFLSFNAIAQEVRESPVEEVAQKVKEKTPVQFEMGLNAPLVFGQLLSSNALTTNPNPYLLTGKLFFGKLGLRAGVGGHINNTIEREGDFADSEAIEDLGIETRFGIEWRSALGNRWKGTFGLDGIFFSNKNITILDSGFDEVRTGTVNTGWGVGPVLGLQFFITDRLSILSEGAFYYTQAEAQTSRLFKNFPEFDDELGSINTTSLRINLPTTFFIVFKF